MTSMDNTLKNVCRHHPRAMPALRQAGLRLALHGNSCCSKELFNYRLRRPIVQRSKEDARHPRQGSLHRGGMRALTPGDSAC